jgi:hypothetical protein
MKRIDAHKRLSQAERRDYSRFYAKAIQRLLLMIVWMPLFKLSLLMNI